VVKDIQAYRQAAKEHHDCDDQNDQNSVMGS
jgi:hypothetical protein